MFKAVIFDCFGVLVRDALRALVNELDDKQKALKIHDAVLAGSRGLIDAESTRKILEETLGLSREELSRKMSEGEVKNKELLDYILDIRKKYKTAILSNVRPGGLDDRFTASELKKHFDVVVGSGDIGYAKPDTEAYTITADKLGVRLEECIAVDDKEPFCEAARALGMKAVLYKSFKQMKKDVEKILAKDN